MGEIFQLLETDEVLRKGKEMAEMITRIVYSDEDKAKFSRIIREFNELYYFMNKQTWSITTWMGVHVLKPPTDMWIYQELIYQIKPDLIIETGTMFGGSALFMRNMLDIVDCNGSIISIDINQENIDHKAKEKSDVITFYHGSSIEQETLTYVKDYIEMNKCKRVMVVLDSDHEKEHVLEELRLYAPLVSIGSILIVEDTNNHHGPKEAVDEWYPLHRNQFFKNLMCEKFMLTFNRDGYYERIA